MLPIKFILKCTIVVAVSLFFVACSSTSEVRELAKITAANSSLVNTELSSFAKKRREIADRRLEAIASLRNEAELQQVTFETYRQGAQAAAVIAGEKNIPNYALLIGELTRTSSAIHAYQQSFQLKQASINQAILASQQPLVIPKSDLSTISEKLGGLAKKTTYKEQLQFLTVFFSEVLKDIKAANEESDQTTSNHPDTEDKNNTAS